VGRWNAEQPITARRKTIENLLANLDVVHSRGYLLCIAWD